MAKKVVKSWDHKHGRRTKIYGVWVTMRQRCTKKYSPKYRFYGGRGISVCERWEKFKNFYEDMGMYYREGLTLDRKDTNGNYSKENCRWITQKEQCRNTRNNVFIEFNGEKKCLAEWAEITGIPSYTIGRRHKKGQKPEEILKK